MTWTKTSDDFADDCWKLSDAAYRLHHEGLTWSNRKLLDCRIPKEDLHRFKRPEAISELLRLKFWEVDGDDYVIIHHASYQRTAEQVIRMQDSRRANGAKGGRPKAPSREVWQKATSEPSSEPTGTGQGQDGPRREDGEEEETDAWSRAPRAPRSVPVPRPSGDGCSWCTGGGCPQCRPDLFP